MHVRDLSALGPEADFQGVTFDPQPTADHGLEPPACHDVVVVGAGPVGLSLAIDLAQQGLRVVVLDDDNRLSSGSRAICFAKRTLEVFDRLGCAEPMVAKGVSWQTGRVFLGDAPLYQFDLLPESGHERPAFINLQQYHVEGQLAARAGQLPQIDIRWRHRVCGIEQDADGVLLSIETPDGPYRLRAGYVAACDGSRSAVRELMGLESKGQVFRDRFLIADVRMEADFPAERWFWFDPPFHPGQSVLLHKQADNVWRIDFQLGWDADPEREKQPEHILPRVQALLGRDARFELVWASVYTFGCRRMAGFRQGRVLFAGDAAHGVSPFGARGANSGVQDADNLGWKLAAVLRGDAPDALLDSYAEERERAADENILNSTRATDFITPKSAVSRLFRDAVLHLARDHGFARELVNSGRLSRPTSLSGCALLTEDAPRAGQPDFADAALRPGDPALDAPLAQAPGWLLRSLSRTGFTALVFAGDAQADPAGHRAVEQVLQAAGLLQAAGGLAVVRIDAQAAHALAWRRYDARPGTVYLLRPDQHVCARWRAATAADVLAAQARALARVPHGLHAAGVEPDADADTAAAVAARPGVTAAA